MFFKSWDQNWAYISMVWMIWYDCSKKKIEDVTFSWSKLVERRSIIFETLKAEVEGLWGFKGVLKNNGYCTHGGSKMFLFLTPSSIGGLLSLQYLCIVYTTWYKIFIYIHVRTGTYYKWHIIGDVSLWFPRYPMISFLSKKKYGPYIHPYRGFQKWWYFPNLHPKVLIPNFHPKFCSFLVGKPPWVCWGFPHHLRKHPCIGNLRFCGKISMRLETLPLGIATWPRWLNGPDIGQPENVWKMEHLEISWRYSKCCWDEMQKQRSLIIQYIMTIWQFDYFFKKSIRMFPKIVGEIPPNHPWINRVFPLF